VDGFIRNTGPLKALKVPTIINIWGTTVEEYAESRGASTPSAASGSGTDVSCPNIKERRAVRTDPKLLSQVVGLPEGDETPLITKMIPMWSASPTPSG